MAQLTCIACPRGCRLEVSQTGGVTIENAGCLRGVEYGREEMENPTRMATSTVAVSGGDVSRCPVRTNRPAPKAKIVELVRSLASVQLAAPVAMGDVVVKDALGTGVDIVATRTISKTKGDI